MVSVNLREATADDARFLADCFLRSMRESIAASRGDWSEQRERTQFEQQLELRHTQIIASSGVDVGFLTVIPDDLTLHIHTLCLAPEHQGAGIGSEVIRRVVAEGSSRGRDIVLSVLKPNKRARALYERLGFKVVAESDRHRHLKFARHERARSNNR